ncbi:hypothetical protein L596_029913 [Steinernema carpocapsae]|uniref:Uncharacterized protein n=1 Tax=Steinernema carpocapsae TaxID=34508 RepID=A0A4U5LR72_STECR|nr:hypothetical protein L596_029913 [Steinernema carpocapsae]
MLEQAGARRSVCDTHFIFTEQRPVDRSETAGIEVLEPSHMQQMGPIARRFGDHFWKCVSQLYDISTFPKNEE